MVLKKLSNEIMEMRKAMEKMTLEIHETNKVIQESMLLTSNTIKEMSDNTVRAAGENRRSKNSGMVNTFERI